MFALGGLLIFLIAAGSSPLTLGVWLGNSFTLAWNHRNDLAQRPGFRLITR